MLHAITSGDCRAVQKLLRKHRGWKNRHLLNTGNTPLMIAAGTGKSLVLQLLLDSKADVDVRSRGMGPQAGATALLISAVTGNCVCARKLLDETDVRAKVARAAPCDRNVENQVCFE